MLTIAYKDLRTNLWVRDTHATEIRDINSNVRTIKWSCAERINRLKQADTFHVSLRGHHTATKYDNGDQPNGGGTTWINTGPTRSGQIQREQEVAVVYTISLVRSSDRVDTPGMTEAKSE